MPKLRWWGFAFLVTARAEELTSPMRRYTNPWGDLNWALLQRRPAKTQQPNLYLEPKWLRYKFRTKMRSRRICEVTVILVQQGLYSSIPDLYFVIYTPRLRMPGVEPGSQAWEACMIPLHYMRSAYTCGLPPLRSVEKMGESPKHCILNIWESISFFRNHSSCG